MKDLTSPRLIKLKGILFLFIALISAAQILCLHADWHTALLLACCIWGSTRFYYFAFYVIEKYVDPSFRFAGLWDFACYLVGRRGGSKK